MAAATPRAADAGQREQAAEASGVEEEEESSPGGCVSGSEET